MLAIPPSRNPIRRGVSCSPAISRSRARICGWTRWSTLRQLTSGTRTRNVWFSMPTTSVRRASSAPTASGHAACSRASVRAGEAPKSRAAHWRPETRSMTIVRHLTVRQDRALAKTALGRILGVDGARPPGEPTGHLFLK